MEFDVTLLKMSVEVKTGTLARLRPSFKKPSMRFDATLKERKTRYMDIMTYITYIYVNTHLYVNVLSDIRTYRYLT